MPTITITAHGHSCIRLQREDATLVIDPGSFSDPNALDGADAVLVTHEHPDHVAADRLIAALRSAPALHVWAPHDVVAQLTAAGADATQVHVAGSGDTFRAGGFDIQALGGRHAVVHPTLPGLANLAYLVDGVALHPGDSFALAPADMPVEVVFVPVSAPWLKLAEAADYVHDVGAPIAVPIHDGILNDQGKALTDRVMGALVGATQYRRLAPGEALVITKPRFTRSAPPTG